MDAPSDVQSFSTGGNSSKNSESLHVQAFSLRDQANPHDALGFDLYVQALADFLLAPKTEPPLTISIEGPWGSGKSSFMLQLKSRLKDESPASTCVDFNAWRYEKQEEVWAAFALTVTRSLRNQATLFNRTLGDFKLYLSRIRGPKEKIKLAVKGILWLTLLYGCVTGAERLRHASPVQRNSYVQTLWESIARNSERSSPPHWIYGVIDTSLWSFAALLLFGVIWRIPENLRRILLEVELEKYIDHPDYRGKAAFVDAFAEDFSKTVRAYAPKKGGKIFVFIDDIDRCEPPKAADLMQAMNLMIDKDGSLFFILGLDREKVASAIAFKFREVVKFMFPAAEVKLPGSDSAVNPVNARAFGDDFLEKFIQLAFRVPTAASDNQAERFIATLIHGNEHGLSDNGGDYLSKFIQRLFRPALSLPSSGISRFPLGTRVAAGQSPDPSPPRRATHDPYRIESGPESGRILKVLLEVREIFDCNPRRIKAFLNVYRLALYIASRQGLLDFNLWNGKSEVSPEQIGAFVALTTRHPTMLTEAIRNPQFFRSLEMICKGLSVQGVATGTNQHSAEIDAILPWSSKPGVRNLLIKETYSLSNFPAIKFLTILPEIPAPQKHQPVLYRALLAPEIRAAYQDLYSKVHAAVQSSMDLETVHILNKWQLEIDRTLIEFDEYGLTQDKARFYALQNQIRYVNDGIKELRNYMSSVASQFVPAGDVIIAIDRVLALMPSEFPAMAFAPTAEPPNVPGNADPFRESGLESLESDAHISREDVSA